MFIQDVLCNVVDPGGDKTRRNNFETRHGPYRSGMTLVKARFPDHGDGDGMKNDMATMSECRLLGTLT